MKVDAECVACILSRAAAEAKEATTNPALRFRAMTDLLRLLVKDFTPSAVPADLGTKRDRVINRVTGNNDPYKRNKRLSNEKALKLLEFKPGMRVDRKMIADKLPGIIELWKAQFCGGCGYRKVCFG